MEPILVSLFAPHTASPWLRPRRHRLSSPHRSLTIVALASDTIPRPQSPHPRPAPCSRGRSTPPLSASLSPHPCHDCTVALTTVAHRCPPYRRYHLATPLRWHSAWHWAHNHPCAIPNTRGPSGAHVGMPLATCHMARQFVFIVFNKI